MLSGGSIKRAVQSPLARCGEVMVDPPACSAVDSTAAAKTAVKTAAAIPGEFDAEVIAADQRSVPPPRFDPFGAPVSLHRGDSAGIAKLMGEFVRGNLVSVGVDRGQRNRVGDQPQRSAARVTGRRAE